MVRQEHILSTLTLLLTQWLWTQAQMTEHESGLWSLIHYIHDPDAGEDRGQRRRGRQRTRCWVVSPTQWTWTWVNPGRCWWTGHLVCCSPWGLEESDATWWLNNMVKEAEQERKHADGWRAHHLCKEDNTDWSRGQGWQGGLSGGKRNKFSSLTLEQSMD